MSIQIRRAEAADLRAQGDQAAAYVSWMRSLDPRLSISENTALRWTQHTERRATEGNGVILLAHENDRPLGFAEIDFYESGAWLDVPKYAFLRNLLVGPDFQKRGVGRTLLDGTIADARSRGLSVLRTRQSVKLPESIECWRRRDFSPAYVEVSVNLRPTSPISPGRAVRKMIESDLENCSRLYEAFIQAETSFGAPWRLVPGWQTSWIERMRARIYHPDSCAFVAEADGRVAGFGAAGLVNQPAYLSPPRYGRIEHVVVAEPYRKRGLGYAIAQRLLSHFQSTLRIMEVHAQLWHTDTIGRSFWRKLDLADLAVWLYKKL